MNILNFLPVTFLLLWNQVLSAPDTLECCYCETLDLKTKNPGLKPNIKPSPFKILVNERKYSAGGADIHVNITSVDSTRTFVDFMLQAITIDKDGEIKSENPVGIFTNLDDNRYSTIRECGGIRSNDRLDKSNIRFSWRNIDVNNRDHVIFRATIVESRNVNYWLRELSQPVEEIRLPPLSSRKPFNHPLIPVIDTSECGRVKSCYRIPDGCWEPYCDYIATWRKVGVGYDIELGAMTDGYTGRYVAMAISDDTKWGEDVVLQCVNNGTTGLTVVNVSRSYDDHSMQLLEPQAQYAVQKQEGQMWGRRLRCRFTVIPGFIPDFPEGFKHVLLSRGAASNGYTQRHGHGVGEIPVATPDEVSLQDNSANIGDYARYSLVKAHGILMILAWAFFGTTGLLWTKYYKTMWPNKRFFGERYWFVVHFNCMSMLVLLVVIAFIIIFVEVGGYSRADYLPYEAHPILGIIIFCCILLNPIIALLRPAEDHKCRPCVNWIHWFFGTVAWCLAIPNMFIGMDFGKAHVPWWATWILCIYILYHIIVEVTLEVHQCCTHKKNKERRKKYEFQKRENPKARIPEPEPAGRVFKRNMLLVHFIITCIVNFIMLIAIAAS